MGRLYQYACDADLGDTRCGVAILAASGTVSAADEDRVLTVEGLGAFAEDWFTRGRLVFTSGANVGAAIEVKRHALTADFRTRD